MLTHKNTKNSIKYLARSRGKHDRYQSNLLNLKAGVKHLQDKLEPVRRDLNAEKVALSESSLPDVLWGVGDILVEILARIREREITGEINGTSTATSASVRKSRRNIDKDDEDKIINNDEVEGEDDDILDEQVNRPYNQRIVLPSAMDDLYGNNDSFDDCYGDPDEEELSRERVKKASTSIVLAQQRKMARERRRS